MRYRHRLFGECTLLQQYSTHWTVQTSQGIKSCSPEYDLTEIQDQPAQVLQFTAASAAGSPSPAAAPPPPTTPVQTISDNSVASQGVDINHLSHVAIAKALPSLGKIQARRIKERQPEVGYKDFAEFRKINGDLFDEEAVWSVLESQISFEVVRAT